MKFKIDAEDKCYIKISIALLALLTLFAFYCDLHLYKPERLIQNRLNAYGIQVSDISIESQEGTGRTKTYTLSNPPIDPKTGQVLAHWTITKGGTMGMIVMVSCTDVTDSVDTEPVVLTVEQYRLLEEYEKLTGRQKQQLFVYLQAMS